MRTTIVFTFAALMLASLSAQANLFDQPCVESVSIMESVQPQGSKIQSLEGRTYQRSKVAKDKGLGLKSAQGIKTRSKTRITY